MLLHNGMNTKWNKANKSVHAAPEAVHGRFLPFRRLPGCDRSHIATFRICR